MKAFGITQADPIKSQYGHKNEDAFFKSPNDDFILVTDGLGGHGGLQFPSQWTIEFFEKNFETKGAKTLQWGLALFERARENLIQTRKASPFPNASCTLVMLWRDHDNIHTVWCGDSRAYRFRNNTLYRLSEDHDYLYDKIQNGIITPQKASFARRAVDESQTASEAWKQGGTWGKKLFQKRNLMCSELSSGPIDHASFEYRENDVFILSTDGVHDNLKHSQIQDICRQSKPEDLHQSLFDASNRAMFEDFGKHDDCTVLTMF